MPSQATFRIKQNTPEADKLERRLHEQLKAIWDPAADATVARYLTAMLAKGYERKKIHTQLKAILQEPVTVQLLDWLYKHLRLHGNEYQSREASASSKLTPKTPAGAAKTLQATEDELRLEDLEAQQLEGSDLDDEEPGDDDQVSDAVAANRDDAAVAQRKEASQEPAAQPQQSTGDLQGGEGPSGTTRPAARAPETQPPPSFDGAPAAGTSGGSGRRARQPIPVPNFADSSRGGVSGAAGPSGNGISQQHAQPRDISAAGSSQPVADQKQAGPAGERRRLKSSVVLDWHSWEKQKQPDQAGEEKRGPDGADGAAAKAPQQESRERRGLLERSLSDLARMADLPGSQRLHDSERERGRVREGGRGREVGTEGGPRKQQHEPEADRPGPRQRDRDGDASARRGHERDSERERDRRRGSAEPGGRNRSRSRSRSRSPRGRRSGRAPIAAPANLLKTALRGVEGGAAAPGSRGASSPPPRDGAGNGARPSVFARLGASSAGGADEGAARVSVLERLEGKAQDAAAPGRKRGLEGAMGQGDGDAAVLGSPPKAARSLLDHRSQPTATVKAPSQHAPTAAATGATGRQHRGTPPAAAVSGGAQPPQSRQSGMGAGSSAEPAKGDTAVAAGVAAEGEVDPKTAELEALRRQMADMQEHIARMEATKTQPQQPMGAPQQALPLRHTITAPVPGAMPLAGGGGRMGAPVDMSNVFIEGGSGDDVIIEGGSGSPLRQAPFPRPELLRGAEQQRLAAAQLEADMRSVVVENVHFLANEEVLAAHFSVAGPVKNVTVIRDNFTRRPTGVAVVEMATEQATQAAAALSGSLLMNCPIVVVLKAALMLQSIASGPGMAAVGPARTLGMPPAVVGVGPGIPGAMGGGRLNPAAAPFIPASSVPPAVVPAGPGRPPAGSSAGRGLPTWQRPNAGGRGAGGFAGGPRPFAGVKPYVWVRDSGPSAESGSAGAGAVAKVGEKA